jgi:PAS domain S-box-containing protein
VEFVNYRKDGTTYWNALSVSPVHDAYGRLTHFVGVQKDVTDRKRIEVELRDREERYRLVSRATNDVIWDWDMTTGELQWNEAVSSTFGYPAGTMPSRVEWWYEQIHPDDRDRVVRDIHAAVDEGEEAWSAEYRFLRRDGEYASVLDRGVVAREPDGRALRMIGSMMDVTEDRWRAETQQFLAEASRALGASLDCGRRCARCATWRCPAWPTSAPCTSPTAMTRRWRCWRATWTRTARRRCGSTARPPAGARPFWPCAAARRSTTPRPPRAPTRRWRAPRRWPCRWWRAG